MDSIYSKNAMTPWKQGLIALNEQQFASAIKDVSQNVNDVIQGEDIYISLSQLIIRHIYPNLCLNLPHFGAHYTGAARRQNFKSSMGPNGLKYSPF